MRVLKNHFFYFHQANLGGVFVLSKLHGDVFDVFRQLRDHYIFQRINAPPGDVGRNRGTARVQIKRG